MVIAGLKCPPDVGAQVMMAKAIPMAKACFRLVRMCWKALRKIAYPANLKDRTKRSNTKRRSSIQCKCADRRNTRKHVEKDTGSFSHAFSKYSRSFVLEVQLALRHWFWRHDMTGYVPLKGITDSDFNIASIKGRSVRSLQMLGHCRGEIFSCMGPERKMKEDNHRT